MNNRALRQYSPQNQSGIDGFVGWQEHFFDVSSVYVTKSMQLFQAALPLDSTKYNTSNCYHISYIATP